MLSDTSGHPLHMEGDTAWGNKSIMTHLTACSKTWKEEVTEKSGWRHVGGSFRMSRMNRSLTHIEPDRCIGDGGYPWSSGRESGSRGACQSAEQDQLLGGWTCCTCGLLFQHLSSLCWPLINQYPETEANTEPPDMTQPSKVASRYHEEPRFDVIGRACILPSSPSTFGHIPSYTLLRSMEGFFHLLRLPSWNA